MKKTFFSLFILTAAAFSTNANAQATATADAGAVLVAPIAIVENTPLNFGKLASPTAGTIAAPAAGTTFTKTGGVVMVDATPQSFGLFTVTGAGNLTYTIALSPASVTLSNGAAGTMTADTFTTVPATTGTLDGTGTQSIKIGATLKTGATQAAGVYQGSYSVTVNYN
jgi:hypothetical protein